MFREKVPIPATETTNIATVYVTERKLPMEKDVSKDSRPRLQRPKKKRRYISRKSVIVV